MSQIPDRMTRRVKSRLTNTQRAQIQKLWEQIVNLGATIKRYPSALVALAIVLGFVVMALAAPMIAPYDPQANQLDAAGETKSLEAPSGEHLFGTTHLGQDVFSQWVWGTRLTLFVGFMASLSATTIGTIVGLLAGYYKGTFDLIIMRVVDGLYGVPIEPVLLVFALIWGGSIWLIISAFVLFLWRSVARVVRAEALSVSNKPFVKAARSTGASDLRIIFLHIAPNILPLVFIYGTLNIANGIILEAGMSFLGVGAQGVSWGTMLQFTYQSGAIREAWWWVIPPGLSITIVVMACFYITRAAEEITNPELRSVTE